jgi:hypothetical protein
MVEGRLEGAENVGQGVREQPLDLEDIGVSLRVVKIPSRTEVDPLGAMPAQISGNQIFCDCQRRGPWE